MAPSNSSIAAPQLQGHVLGGQQPVAGATIQLYAAGITGYGTGAVALLSPATQTDANGNFTIANPAPCPSSISQLYIVATGGNPGLPPPANNTSLALMAAIGPCELAGSQYTISPSAFIDIDEVTTVASVYALAGFMNQSTGQIGSSSTNLIGIANAFQTAANLASISSGQALVTTPAGNGTVPNAEINTLANIIAPCVNSTGTDSSCALLFAAATPSGGTAPVNTLQALYNIATNPASQVNALFSLPSAAAPFQPILSTGPNDWTIALTYTVYSSPAAGMAIDALGDVWIGGNTLAELSPNGSILSGSAGFTGSGLEVTNDPAIDPSGNVWAYAPDLGTGVGVISKFSSSGALLSGSTGFIVYALGGPLAIDGSGDVWCLSNAVLAKLDNNGNLLSGTGYTASGVGAITGIAFDGSENVWASSNFNEAAFPEQPVDYGSIAKFSNSGTSLAVYMAPSFDSATSVALDNSGDAWVTNSVPLGPTIFEFANNATLLSNASGYSGAGISYPFQIAIDGGGNAWVTNASVDGEKGWIVELNSSGTVLSGATGYSIPQSGAIGIAIDGSGNIWTGPTGNSVYEFVGAATPVVTPLSIGVKNKTLGTRP